MASAMLAALAPEAARIRQTIADTVAEVEASTIANGIRTIDETVEQLKVSFDDTVRRLIVPTTIRIDRGDGREPVQITGTVHNAFAECLEWLQSGRNVWLVGPAGCGKTTLARQLAEALDVPFYTTGQVLSEHQVTGFVDAGGSYHTTPFREAFQNGGLWLGDEMDSWSPEAALAANAALANGHASFPDTPTPIAAHKDFFVVAAANTFGHGADREYVGRNEMDAATLDRFVTVPVDYDKALETEIAGSFTDWRDLVWTIRANVESHRIRRVVGTRSIVFGVDALRAGMALDLVTQRLLRGDMDATTWERVSS
jgi:MoxR-like ATPase